MTLYGQYEITLKSKLGNVGNKLGFIQPLQEGHWSPVPFLAHSQHNRN